MPLAAAAAIGVVAVGVWQGLGDSAISGSSGGSGGSPGSPSAGPAIVAVAADGSQPAVSPAVISRRAR